MDVGEIVLFVSVFVALIAILTWVWVRWRTYQAVQSGILQELPKPYDIGVIARYFRTADSEALVAPVPWDELYSQVAQLQGQTEDPSDEPSAPKRSNQFRELGEAAAAGGIVLGGAAVQQYLAIDDHVYAGISHQAGQEFETIGDLSAHLRDKFRHNIWDGVSDGGIDNLKGHIGETYAAEHFEELGIEVEWPETGYQPGWDLLLEGHEVNIKAVADFGSVGRHFDKYPDIPAVVPGDMDGIPEDAVYFDPSGSSEELLEALQAGKEDLVIVDPDLSVDALTHQTEAAADVLVDSVDLIDTAAAGGVPVAALLFSGWREAALLHQQKTDLLNSAKNVALDTAGAWGGGFLGVKGGALVGSVFGPPGTFIGGILGGVGGALTGRAGTNKIKRENYEQALKKLERADEKMSDEIAAVETRIEQKFQDTKSRAKQWLQNEAARHSANVRETAQGIQQWRVEQERIPRSNVLQYLRSATEELSDAETKLRAVLGSPLWRWPQSSESQQSLLEAIEQIRGRRHIIRAYRERFTSHSAPFGDRGDLFGMLAEVGGAKEKVENSLRVTERMRRPKEARLRERITEGRDAVVQARAGAHKQILEEMGRIQTDARNKVKRRVKATRDAAAALQHEAAKLGLD